MNQEQVAAAFTAATAGWRKAKASKAANDCVEINTTLPDWVGVRDSKRGQHSPVLVFHPKTWTAFLTQAHQR